MARVTDRDARRVAELERKTLPPPVRPRDVVDAMCGKRPFPPSPWRFTPPVCGTSAEARDDAVARAVPTALVRLGRDPSPRPPSPATRTMVAKIIAKITGREDDHG
jgi:hypothetical protein